MSVIAVGLALAACGGGGSSGGSGDGGGNGRAAPSSAQLHARLLTADDVGTQWKAGEPINSEDLAAFAQTPCAAATINPAVVKRLTAVVGAQFEPVDRSYRHLIELVVTGDATQLHKDLQSVFSAIESCDAAGSAGVRVTVTQLSIPELGDQRAAYAVTQNPPDGSPAAMSLRTAYVRLGTVAVVVGLVDFRASKDGVSLVSDDNFRALLTKATTKLSA
jgi:hypothetical protein